MVNKLQIVRVDSVTVRKVDLLIGYNIIGRGAATGFSLPIELHGIVSTPIGKRGNDSVVDGNVSHNSSKAHVDNQIIEEAVTIHLAPTGEMTMTPMLACYKKSRCSSRWQSLKVGCEVSIHPGDICSLLPDKSWFKIINADCSAMEEDNDVNGKRKAANPTNEEPPDKKPRSASSVETIYAQNGTVQNDSDTDVLITEEVGDLNSNSRNNVPDNVSALKDIHSTSAPNRNLSVEVIPSNGNNTENTIQPVPAETGATTASKPTAKNLADESKIEENTNRNRDEAGKKIKWDCGRHFSDQTDQQTSETVVNPGEASTSTDGNPTSTCPQTSKDEPPRDKCAYGSECFRRNSDHRMRFSHPGDADYEIPDARPECPYGVRCYRKNPQHKREFKHTEIRRSRAQTPVRGRSTDNEESSEGESSVVESVDESDYEPSTYDATSDDCLSEFDDKSDYDVTSECDDKQ